MKEIEKLINFGIINIDKSSGPTSYLVSEYVKRSLGLKKTSHMGTLDPKVTGVLPITLGRACRLASYIISHDKTYVGVLHTHKECKMKDLQKLINENFVGKIKQTPPRKSAVKIQERTREVFYFEFKEAFFIREEGQREQIDDDYVFGEVSDDGIGTYFLFECKVEGGTYIRKICSDLGEMIGGSHMTELRRTKAGIFDETTMVSLNDFDEAVGQWKKDGKSKKLDEMIRPAEEVVKEIMPYLKVDKSAVKALRNGKPLLKSNVVDKEKLWTAPLGVTTSEAEQEGNDVFALFSGDEFIGIYKRTDEEGIFARSEFVFD